MDPPQLNILQKLEADTLLGTAGLKLFNQQLKNNAANTAGAVEDVSKLGQRLARLSSKVSTLLQELDPIVDKDKESLPAGYMSIELVFTDQVQINTIPDWKDPGNAWYLVHTPPSYLIKIIL